MKKFKLPILLLAICLLVCLVCVMAACDGETATDGTQDNTDTSPSTPEEEKPEQTVEELSKAECENILQAKTKNLLSSVEVANIEGIQLYREYYPIPFYDDNYNPDFVLSSLFNFSEIAITKVNLNGGEVFGTCTLTANADGTVHSVYFVLKTNLFSLERTSYEVLKEELAYLNAYYVSVYENSADIPATDGFFDFNSLVAGETVPSPLTEEDYKAQCTEIINAKTLTLMEMDELSRFATISNLEINSINLETGKIYCKAVKSSSNKFSFYELQTNLNELDSSSYKNLSEALSALKVESMDGQAIIQNHVSDEAYANLVNFVISNSIGWGPAGTYVEILNVSTFRSLTDGSGGRSLSMIVLKDKQCYTIIAKGATGIGRQEDQIKRLLESPSTEVTFTSESFSDFNDIGK